MKLPLIKSSNITSHKLITNKYKITEDNSKTKDIKTLWKFNEEKINEEEDDDDEEEEEVEKEDKKKTE